MKKCSSSHFGLSARSKVLIRRFQLTTLQSSDPASTQKKLLPPTKNKVYKTISAIVVLTVKPCYGFLYHHET